MKNENTAARGGETPTQTVKADGVHWEKAAGKFDAWEVWHNGALYCSVSTSDQAGDIYKRLLNPRPVPAQPATLDQRVEATQALCGAPDSIPVNPAVSAAVVGVVGSHLAGVMLEAAPDSAANGPQLCDCGAVAQWHGDPHGLREFCCAACWAVSGHNPERVSAAPVDLVAEMSDFIRRMAVNALPGSSGAARDEAGKLFARILAARPAAPGALAKFGAGALEVLEENEEWNAETLDAIAGEAYALGLASTGEDGMFKRSAAPDPDIAAAERWLEENRERKASGPAPVDAGGAFLLLFHDGAEVFSVDIKHSQSEAASSVELSEQCNRETGGNVQASIIPLSVVLAAPAKDSARKAALVEITHVLTWSEISRETRNILTRTANILEGAPA